MPTRDQCRAQHAYTAVAQVAAEGSAEVRASYRTLVVGLGAHILRGGLAAAMSYLERYRNQAATERVLDHLAAAGIPGFDGCSGIQLPARVRQLGLDDYILATRETLKVTQWLKRAVQVLLGDAVTPAGAVTQGVPAP